MLAEPQHKIKPRTIHLPDLVVRTMHASELVHTNEAGGPVRYEVWHEGDSGGVFVKAHHATQVDEFTFVFHGVEITLTGAFAYWPDDSAKSEARGMLDWDFIH